MAYVKKQNLQRKPYGAFKEDFTRKVLEATDIVELIGKYTELQECPGESNIYTGKCVIHNGKDETFVIYADKQSFHCFDCGANGNAAAFLMQKHNISFDKAIEQLARFNGISIDDPEIRQTPNNVLKHNLYNIYADAAQFYQQKLNTQEGDIAKQYIKKRQLTDETVKTFRLGYSPTKGNALYKYLSNKGYSEDLMIQAGLIKISETGPYDMFRGRLMFPIIDSKQRVIAFGGRVLDDEHKPKYLNSPESPIFNKSATLYGIHDVDNKKYNYMILCEGNVDVIALHQAGVKNSVATLGTSFTQQHIPIVSQYAKGLLLSFDGDNAGQKAANRTIKTVSDSDIKVRVMSLAPAKDPDEFIKTFGVKEYGERVRRSVDQLDFQLKYTASQYDLDNPQQREDYLNKAVDMIINSEDRELTQEIER